MQIKKLTPIITTDKLEEEKAFYTKYFGFKVYFEYPNGFLSLKSPDNDDMELSIMAPGDCCQSYQGQGVTICFEVDDVDAEHARLTEAGLPIAVGLQDNPWGDRSFIAIDPVGVCVYVYSPIEPTEEYKACFKD